LSEEKPRVVLDYARRREEPLPRWFWPAFGLIVLCGFGCGPLGWIVFLTLSPVWLGLAFGRIGVLAALAVNVIYILVWAGIVWVVEQLQPPQMRHPLGSPPPELVFIALGVAVFCSQLSWIGALVGSAPTKQAGGTARYSLLCTRRPSSTGTSTSLCHPDRGPQDRNGAAMGDTLPYADRSADHHSCAICGRTGLLRRVRRTSDRFPNGFSLCHRHHARRRVMIGIGVLLVVSPMVLLPSWYVLATWMRLPTKSNWPFVISAVASSTLVLLGHFVLGRNVLPRREATRNDRR
jgi:hypothetical protein